MSTTTIWNVLNNTVVDSDIKRGIEIPMIQRDYAQGRNNSIANEIREVFLNNLLKGIDEVVKENKPPLELDFIYGYVESGAFIPLDGQQRLTTLYLLHWYFAFKEQKLNEFKLPFSNFKYQTRQSSEDFLKKLNDGLNIEDFEEIFKNKKSFSSVISDKNWYFVNWNYDLTIQSCITMLDDIHKIFNSSGITLSDLTDEQKPPITFNFLDIRDFGLSDDLYIKMNSRGKPLTKFENLKAELGKFIKLSGYNENYNYSLKHSGGYKSVDLETYFVTKIDTSWTDYFWDLRNNSTNKFDDKLLNLLAFISLNESIRMDVSHFENCLKELDKDDTNLSYYKFKNLKLLKESSIINYIEILDLLVTQDEIIKEYLKDNSFINKESTILSSFENNFKARYEPRILFYAIFKFLISNKGKWDKYELQKWDRLMRNLVVNTIYNKPKDFQDSILSIDILIESYSGDIYNDVLISEIKGFDNQQLKEEKLKIELIKKSAEWQDFILEMESHPYLNGQIMFLLSFSGVYDKYLSSENEWISEIDTTYFDTLKNYFDKFKKLFTKSGLKEFDNELFRRALLAKGDYLLYSTNWSLVIDNHRDISWKRLLKETGNKSSEYFEKKCNYLKELFDDVDVVNIEDSLKEIIKNHDSKDWRKDFIENPILMKKSKEKYLKFFDNENIYVLRVSKYNKYADPEVKSILLKEKMLKNGFEEKDVELGYIDSLNQYGIVRIKNIKPKIVYNLNNNGKYFIKQNSKEDVLFTSESKALKYLVENF